MYLEFQLNLYGNPKVRWNYKKKLTDDIFKKIKELLLFLLILIFIILISYICMSSLIKYATNSAYYCCVVPHGMWSSIKISLFTFLEISKPRTLKNSLICVYMETFEIAQCRGNVQ